MKKTGYIVLAIAFAMLMGACSPKVPVKCGDSILEVSVDKVEEYKKACSTETEPVAQQPACEPAVAVPAIVAEVVINPTPKGSYDYDFMPRGKDQTGTPYADYGIFGIGSVPGPAIIQLDSETIVSVYPGFSFEVDDATDPIWRYSGNIDYLKSMYQYFPGKEIIVVN